MNSNLFERETGKFPISIGTSLALESLVNINENLNHNKKPIKDYTFFWINVSTIFRNLYQSIKNVDKILIKNNDLIILLINELNFLKEWCANEGRGVNLQLYFSKYDIKKLYPYASIRTPHTEKQLLYKKIHDVTLHPFLNNEDYLKEFKIKIFKNKITSAEYQKTIILTSYVYDLINPYLFSKLDLVESHTGKIKPRIQWNTKYHNGSKLHMMPFREDLLQIFGDKETFVPMNFRLIKQIINIAIKDKWTPLTTKDKIKNSINKLDDKNLKDLILNIIK